LKSPIDKVRARGGNKIIQVLVTRACDLFYCSNCTQLLPLRGGHHARPDHDPMHMSPDVFRKALRGLMGWPGVIAMFGGNPCVHPQFEELCQIMREEVPDSKHRGLWTNNLRGHGDVIAKTFTPGISTFNLNLHAVDDAAVEMERHLPGVPIWGRGKSSHHAPILIDYRDVGMTEAQWVAARESCDINQNWSGAVVERFGEPWGYFCEVASSIDAVTGKNHGVPATEGWWRRGMDRFDRQVKYCCDAGCGVPLRAKGHQDSDDAYDVSERWVELTVGSKAKHVGLVADVASHTHEVTDYVGLRK